MRSEGDAAPIGAERRARVLTAYDSVFPDPLVLQAGEEIKVGANDTEWPDFVWCTNRLGTSGWVPQSYISRAGGEAVVLRDYQATELNVHMGDVVVIGEEAGGWFWSTNPAGESGWVPARNLEVY